MQDCRKNWYKYRKRFAKCIYLSNSQVIMKGIILILSAIAALSAAVQCPTGASNKPQDLILQHDDCNKFYKCINGQDFEQSCSSGLHFNLEISQCDVADEVVCGTRNVPENHGDGVNNKLWWIPGWPRPPKPTTTTTTTTKAPLFLENGCPVNLITHWLLPDESDCKAFYSCVWGETVRQVCPSILEFNPILQVCDWPWRAGCAAAAIEH